jgi:hypothetical protein
MAKEPDDKLIKELPKFRQNLPKLFHYVGLAANVAYGLV